MAKKKNLSNLELGKTHHESHALTPGQAIRKYCIKCVGSQQEVQSCAGYLLFNTGKPCPLFAYRLGKDRPSVKVIKAECDNCMGDNPNGCSNGDCNLYPFRKGTNPNYKPQFNKGGDEREYTGKIQ